VLPLGCDAEVDRTEASIAPTGGGDRTPDTCARNPRRRLPQRVGAQRVGAQRVGAQRVGVVPAALASALLVTMLVLGMLPGVLVLGTLPGVLVLGTLPGDGIGAAFAAPPTAASSVRGADRIALVRQSPWVSPSAPNQDLTMGLRIQSNAPPGALALSITVYDHLTSRSGFVETIGGRGLGAVAARSPALPVSALTTDAQGVTHLTIPVVGDTTPTGSGDWTADLGCRPGSCADVYPVKVTLTDSSAQGSNTSSSTGEAQLITYLVYDDPSSTSQPLRFGLVAPLGLASATADSKGRVPAPSSAALASLEGTVGAIGGSVAVPLTLAPDPATLDHLADLGRARQVSAVATLSASPARQTLSESFVPIDAGALVDAGLSGELTAQQQRAAQVLGSPSVGVRASTGTWVARSALDQAAINQLAPDHSHLVVPQNAVSGPTGPLTVTQPFTLTSVSSVSSGSSGSSGHGATPTAMVSDAGLRAHLVAAKGANAPLAAEQLLADLSLIYYEAPNLRGPSGAPAPRGVVAVGPPAWAPDPSFISTVLSGLVGNPVIQPVTLDQLFAQVPVGADGQTSTRHPVTTTGAPPVPAGVLRTARAHEAAFESAAAGSAAGTATAQRLDNLLLAAESSTLSSRQQRAAVGGFSSALDQQLHGLSVRTDTIRLTGGTANVPLTVVRNTPYPVTVVVRLTSDKLRFPSASGQVPGALCQAPQVQSSAGRSSFSALCVLDHSTNAVYVNMRSRTSGDFRIDVTLTSPQGNLVLAAGQLTVRSLSTSAVAIALSVGAALVLAVWWGRTLWRGKRRRGAHAVASAGRSPT
jgi:hypothetical protein